MALYSCVRPGPQRTVTRGVLSDFQTYNLQNFDQPLREREHAIAILLHSVAYDPTKVGKCLEEVTEKIEHLVESKKRKLELFFKQRAPLNEEGEFFGGVLYIDELPAEYKRLLCRLDPNILVVPERLVLVCHPRVEKMNQMIPLPKVQRILLDRLRDNLSGLDKCTDRLFRQIFLVDNKKEFAKTVGNVLASSRILQQTLEEKRQWEPVADRIRIFELFLEQYSQRIARIQFLLSDNVVAINQHCAAMRRCLRSDTLFNLILSCKHQYEADSYLIQISELSIKTVLEQRLKLYNRHNYDRIAKLQISKSEEEAAQLFIVSGKMTGSARAFIEKSLLFSSVNMSISDVLVSWFLEEWGNDIPQELSFFIARFLETRDKRFVNRRCDWSKAVEQARSWKEIYPLVLSFFRFQKWEGVCDLGTMRCQIKTKVSDMSVPDSSVIQVAEDIKDVLCPRLVRSCLRLEREDFSNLKFLIRSILERFDESTVIVRDPDISSMAILYLALQLDETEVMSDLFANTLEQYGEGATRLIEKMSLDIPFHRFIVSSLHKRFLDLAAKVQWVDESYAVMQKVLEKLSATTNYAEHISLERQYASLELQLDQELIALRIPQPIREAGLIDQRRFSDLFRARDKRLLSFPEVQTIVSQKRALIYSLVTKEIEGLSQEQVVERFCSNRMRNCIVKGISRSIKGRVLQEVYRYEFKEFTGIDESFKYMLLLLAYSGHHLVCDPFLEQQLLQFPPPSSSLKNLYEALSMRPRSDTTDVSNLAACCTKITNLICDVQILADSHPQIIAWNALSSHLAKNRSSWGNRDAPQSSEDAIFILTGAPRKRPFVCLMDLLRDGEQDEAYGALMKYITILKEALTYCVEPKLRAQLLDVRDEIYSGLGEIPRNHLII